LTKVLTNSLDNEYGCIYDSVKTRIYECNRNRVIVVTKEYPKYLYYRYGLEHNFQHIPRIDDLIKDDINGVFIIKREELFPITNTNKLTRLEIIKNALLESVCINDKIVEEAMKFNARTKCHFKLDFGPHCFMQTKNNKIVISDLFMER